ncbi:MAG: hypothetical protein WC289_00695 [Patescibacteria group bacterium]|jgi:hypothetical protein
MNEQNKLSLIGYAILVVVAVVSTFLAVFLVNNTKPDAANSNINSGVPININAIDLNNINLITQPTAFDKFTQLKREGKFITVNEKRIISPQFTVNDQEENNRIALEFLQNNSFVLASTGKISNGYLYIKTAAGTSSEIGTIAQNESVYIYLGNKGGHLFRPNSLISTPSEEGYTQYLFDLSNVSFTSIPYNDSNKSYSDNWLTRLNIVGDSFIGGFVSSNRFGVIEEISIAFEGEGTIVLK